MNKHFKQFYHGQWKSDPLFELYVEAWTAYHIAADKVDGHLPPWDRSMVRWAIQAGNNAMERVFRNAHTQVPSGFDKEGRKLFSRANMEALRRLGE